MLVIGFSSLLFYAVFNIRYYKNYVKTLVQSTAGKLVAVTALFLFMGDFFEDASFQHHVYFEEIFELLGYIFLFWAALLFPGQQSNRELQKGTIYLIEAQDEPIIIPIKES